MSEVLKLKGRNPEIGESNEINEVETWAPLYAPEDWTDEEKALLEPFFSNLDNPVFVIKNMPEEVVAAISSRVSRAEPSIRRVFWNEYIKPILATEEGSGMIDSITHLRDGGMERVANSERARTFFRTWLAEYGDDSIAEMGNLHLGIEGISQIAVKEVEDDRFFFEVFHHDIVNPDFFNNAAATTRGFDADSSVGTIENTI